jgi:hypothetical protein
VKCNIYGWMRSCCIVLRTSHFAITGNDGRFVLPDLPPGKHTVTSWHETFATLQQEITVTPGESTMLEFVFAPSPDELLMSQVFSFLGPLVSCSCKRSRPLLLHASSFRFLMCQTSQCSSEEYSGGTPAAIDPRNNSSNKPQARPNSEAFNPSDDQSVGERGTLSPIPVPRMETSGHSTPKFLISSGF